jgi:D-galactarolactone isomerase
MSLIRSYSGAKPSIMLPPGTIDTQMHMYLDGYPAMPGGPPLPVGLPGADEYRSVMRWLGISRVVITQGNAHQHDNSNLIACLHEMGDCARGVAVITAATDDQEMERLHRAGVTGARIMDLPGGAVRLDQLEEVDARAAQAGWMIAVQFDGSDIAQHFERLQKLRSRYVIDHHAKIFRGAQPDGPEVDLIKRLIDRGNCWFKFAGCYESSQTGGPDFSDVAAISREVAAYAPERIIWGTNFPHNLARTTAEYPNDAELLDTVLGWIEDDAARQLALVDNPTALFGFPN